VNEPVVERALALIEVGRSPQAVEALRAAGVPDQGSTRACCVLAQAAIQAKDWPVADRASGMALARSPRSEWALRLKAMALTGVGLHAEAERVAREAVAIGPYLAATHMTLARCQFKARDLIGARASATTALELDPTDPSISALLGHIELDRHSNRAAQAHLTRSIELDPLQADVLNNLGVVAQRRHRYLTAARRFRASLSVHPLPIADTNLKHAQRFVWVLPLLVVAGLVLAASAPWMLGAFAVVQVARYAYDRWIDP
jgi:Flp pilus assembly protein TadD